MSTIVTRAGKGSPLTHTEVDNNFTNLNTDKYQSGDSASFSSITNTGNLTFTGTGNRITGDFSNATVANRVAFQTSTTNSATNLVAIPNGTNLIARFQGYTGSTANESFVSVGVNGAAGLSQLSSDITGTGTYLPLAMYTGGSERLRIDTSGNVGIGTTSVESGFRLHVTGNGFFSPSSGTIGKVVVDNVDQRLVLGSYFEAGVGQYSFISSTNNAETGNLPLLFNTGTTERMRIDSSGNVIQATGSYFLGNGGGFGWGDLSTYVGGTSASDFINFITNSSERMRIDSSGNVGIGTSSPGERLQVSGNVSANTGNFIANRGNAQANTAGSGLELRIDGTTYAAIRQPAAEVLAFYRGNGGTTETMRIDSSGNVGIGTSSPAQKFVVSDGGVNFCTSVGGGVQYVGTTTNSDMALITNSIERMRITSGGEVYIAGTTDQGAYNLQCNGTGVWGAGAYVNGSDERIKDDIAPLDSGLDVVAKLNPVTYKYKEDWSKDQSTQTGFIAQELLTALEGKNYIDGVVQQGGEYMSVAYQNIIPILTKAIQELKAELDATKAEVALLKSK